MDKTDIGRDQIIGECKIGLENLKDQYKHDDWFNLANPNNPNQINGKIRLTLHWIHSRKKFL
jgi:hypothetical protein